MGIPRIRLPSTIFGVTVTEYVVAAPAGAPRPTTSTPVRKSDPANTRILFTLVPLTLEASIFPLTRVAEVRFVRIVISQSSDITIPRNQQGRFCDTRGKKRIEYISGNEFRVANCHAHQVFREREAALADQTSIGEAGLQSASSCVTSAPAGARHPATANGRARRVTTGRGNPRRTRRFDSSMRSGVFLTRGLSR